jgi:hypothetical protein
MRVRYVAVLAILSFLAGAAGAQSAPNWLLDVLMVRSTQTQVARHPIDKGRYYLCWSDGTNRFGLWFKDGSLSAKLRNIKPGKRARMSDLLGGTTSSTWTSADEKFCFPN